RLDGLAGDRCDRRDRVRPYRAFGDPPRAARFARWRRHGRGRPRARLAAGRLRAARPDLPVRDGRTDCRARRRPLNPLYALARPFLFCLDAERAHDVALASIEAAHRSGLVSLVAKTPAPLPVEAFGLQFDNPVGLAAGLDKDGAHIDALAALGFGFIEVGTTTPRPQPGNP